MPLTETERIKLKRFMLQVPPHQQAEALQYAFTRTKQDRYGGMDAATTRGLRNPQNLADGLAPNPYAKFLMPAHRPFYEEQFIGPPQSHGFWWDLADTIHNWTGKVYGSSKDWLQSRFPEPMQALETLWELWEGASYEMGGQVVDVGVTGINRLWNPGAQSRLQQIRNSPEYQKDPVPFEAGRVIGSIALWEYLGAKGLFSRTKLIEPGFGFDVGRAAKAGTLAGLETGFGTKAGGASTEEAVKHGLFAAGLAVPFDAVFQGVEGIIRANAASRIFRERSPFYGEGVEQYYDELLRGSGPQGEAGWFRRWIGKAAAQEGKAQPAGEALLGKRVSGPIDFEQRMFQPAQVPARRGFDDIFTPSPPKAEARVFAMGGARRIFEMGSGEVASIVEVPENTWGNMTPKERLARLEQTHKRLYSELRSKKGTRGYFDPFGGMKIEKMQERVYRLEDAILAERAIIGKTNMRPRRIFEMGAGETPSSVPVIGNPSAKSMRLWMDDGMPRPSGGPG